MKSFKRVKIIYLILMKIKNSLQLIARKYQNTKN